MCHSPYSIQNVVSAILIHDFTRDDVGIDLPPRTDGGFYKPQRLKAESKVMVDIWHAQSQRPALCTLCASDERELQHMVDLFSIWKKIGLTYKTKLKVYHAVVRPSVLV